MRNEVLGAGMLDLRLVMRVFVPSRLQKGGVKDLRFNLGMNRQCLADFLGQFGLLRVFACLLERLKPVLHLPVVGFEKRNCIGWRSAPCRGFLLRFAFCHVVLSNEVRRGSSRWAHSKPCPRHRKNGSLEPQFRCKPARVGNPANTPSGGGMGRVREESALSNGGDSGSPCAAGL